MSAVAQSGPASRPVSPTGHRPIKTFLFDMGNVLVKFCHERMCRQIGELCGHEGPEVKRRLLDSGVQWDFERGKVTEAVFMGQMEEILGVKMDREQLYAAGSDIFHVNEEMMPVLESLKRQGFRLVLFSNVGESHFRWIGERFDFLRFFDDTVLSYKEGGIKPEPHMYEAALGRIHCEPGEVFYTDDIADYVVKGRTYGFQAEVFTTADSLRAQLAPRGVSV
ncbi:HAD family hydrolase [Planctomyces sp. SH-PL14]|uniref:HAD family hydrolase n=1 Tax=Planctomyces sp. SH-PL14 TaxID=1632864 RepID=UPI00078CD380|nr:HAD family phosphatase [Planctomyces sp. SH-PL14]AMV17783.1 Alpha-D-glucose-1-phosphate phosphatase YihX [Planctomyces sp. SH-PL14]